MKKFYLHDGTEQTGPFNIDELKSKNITKSTPIWHEGLSEWTTTEKVDELQILFQINTPPPFSEKKQTPPPINKLNEQTETKSQAQPTTNQPIKNKKSYVGLIITSIVFVIILAIGAVIVTNNPNVVPGVKFEINTPKPTVLTSRADGKKSGLFNARTTVYATVMNQGGDGNVLVTFHVYQNSNAYDRSKTIYLLAGQSEDLEVTFEEVDYVSGDITYNVNAIAQ